MKVIYKVSQNKIEDGFDLIELEISQRDITEEEMSILRKFDFQIEKIEKDLLQIRTDNFFNYVVEVNNEDKGIFLEKTKEFYKYIGNMSHIRENSPLYDNLIIWKNGIKIQMVVGAKVEIWI